MANNPPLELGVAAVLDGASASVGKEETRYSVFLGDCFDWMKRPENELSVHSIVTDPPFALLEYDDDQMEKRLRGRGGVWRIPPRIGGSRRKPIPRFTVLRSQDVARLRRFFFEWGKLAQRVLVPGGHVFIATNALLLPHLAGALIESGFEYRGAVVRIVRTLRGGDRPKLAEREFPAVSVTPRGCYEPWLILRKPISEKTVAANLRRWGTGGLRRTPDGKPFPDVLRSETPPDREERLAPHPSLKPQRFMRQIVWASLPLGVGRVLDPFMGSGSTIAAALAAGYSAIGIERRSEFYAMAARAIPELAKLRVEWEGFDSDWQLNHR